MIFEQTDCEIPKSWSQLATNVVVSKYFYGDVTAATVPPNAQAELVRQLVDRVTRTIADWGREDGYFATDEDAERFYDELTSLCLQPVRLVQLARLVQRRPVPPATVSNGPANNWRWDDGHPRHRRRPTSAYKYPQALGLLHPERQRRHGSHHGARHAARPCSSSSAPAPAPTSPRSAPAARSSPAAASPPGPVSFMRVYDADRQRRQVRRQNPSRRQDADPQGLAPRHPRVHRVQDQGGEEGPGAHPTAATRPTSTARPTARSCSRTPTSPSAVTDAFLRAAESRRRVDHPLRHHRPAHGPPYKARMLLDKIAEGTWLCGDPGVQYEDTIQRWHTCPNTAPINSSNPCCEYMFLDDTACNLASINLMKFRTRGRRRSTSRRFRAACRVFITAQEILVDHASYPTERIAANSHKFRPLGLGYANLGSLHHVLGPALRLRRGPRARRRRSPPSCTARPTCTSAEHAGAPRPVRRLRAQPRADAPASWRCTATPSRRSTPPAPTTSETPPRKVWDECLDLGRQHGYRNSQVTVLAPTGTIAFMMDCDTTGIEPDIALVKYKQLAGGGMLKIVNRTVPMALQNSGYDEPEIQKHPRLHRRARHDRRGARPQGRAPAGLRLRLRRRRRAAGRIHWHGHVRMMAAAQPFLSGAISKTVNMPSEATVERHPRRLPRRLEARPQGAGDLPRRLQGKPAA